MAEALLSDFTPSTKKLGYNGYRQKALTGAAEYCEIKHKECANRIQRQKHISKSVYEHLQRFAQP